MGKKSRRKKQGPKVKECVSAISKDVHELMIENEVSYREAHSIWTHCFLPYSCMDNFKQLAKAETEILLAAEALVRVDEQPPSRAAFMYFKLGQTLNRTKMGDRTDPNFDEYCDQATAYFIKAFEIVENTGEKLSGGGGIHNMHKKQGLTIQETYNTVMNGSMQGIVQLGLMHSKFRPDELTDIVKRFIKISPSYQIPSDLIILMIKRFDEFGAEEHMIGILSSIHDLVDEFWSRDEMVKVNEGLGKGYFKKLDYTNAVEYYNKALLEARTPEIKVEVLLLLVGMYNVMCETKSAVDVLRQIDEIFTNEEQFKKREFRVSQFWHDRMNYFIANGDLLLRTEMAGKRKKYCVEEALGQYERALDISERQNLKDVYLYLHQTLGNTNGRLGHWDKAEEHFNLATKFLKEKLADISSRNIFKPHEMSRLCEDHARALLDQYKYSICNEEHLVPRTDLLDKIQDLCMTSLESEIGTYSKDQGYLHLAQAKYFMGELEEARKYLSLYFTTELEKEGGACRVCLRQPGKGKKLVTCGNCCVVEYCCKAHQKLDWRTQTVSHKVLCPFLKRWRIVAKAEEEVLEAYEDIFGDFFEATCVFSNNDTDITK